MYGLHVANTQEADTCVNLVIFLMTAKIEMRFCGAIPAISPQCTVSSYAALRHSGPTSTRTFRSTPHAVGISLCWTE